MPSGNTDLDLLRLLLVERLVDGVEDEDHLRDLDGHVVPVRRQPVHVEAQNRGLQVQEVEAEALLHASQLKREAICRVLDGVHLHELGHEV